MYHPKNLKEITLEVLEKITKGSFFVEENEKWVEGLILKTTYITPLSGTWYIFKLEKDKDYWCTLYFTRKGKVMIQSYFEYKPYEDLSEFLYEKYEFLEIQGNTKKEIFSTSIHEYDENEKEIEKLEKELYEKPKIYLFDHAREIEKVLSELSGMQVIMVYLDLWGYQFSLNEIKTILNIPTEKYCQLLEEHGEICVQDLIAEDEKMWFKLSLPVSDPVIYLRQ